MEIIKAFQILVLAHLATSIKHKNALFLDSSVGEFSRQKKQDTVAILLIIFLSNFLFHLAVIDPRTNK